MLVRAQILDRDACAATCATVLALRERWTRRIPDAEFYTLGAASYLDRDPERYRALAAATNPLLAEHFGALHAAVAAALAGVVGAPVEHAPALARPGFHVWGVPGIPTAPVASLHFDLQYENHLWPADACLADTISFTLPLHLPRRGGGLTMWDTTKPRVDAFYRTGRFGGTLDDLTVLMPERLEAYALGELVVHSGLELHRIAPIAAVEPDDLRVTLQGHGVRVGARWQIYW